MKERTGVIGHVDHAKTLLTPAIIGFSRSTEEIKALIDTKNKYALVYHGAPGVFVEALTNAGFLVEYTTNSEDLKEPDQEVNINGRTIILLDEASPGMGAALQAFQHGLQSNLRKAYAPSNHYEGKGGEIPSDKAEKRRQIETRRQERWEKSQRGRK